MPAKGDDIPEELFERIVLHVVDDADIKSTDYDDGSLRERRIICPASTVCLHWANICRPVIFSNCVLRHASQIRRLDTLLESPCSPRLQPISKLLQGFKVKHTAPIPWIHELSFLLTKHRDKLDVPIFDVDFVLHTPSTPPEVQAPLRSIVQYLPRSIPLMTRRFQQIRLDAIPFTVASDFFHLIGELTDLRGLRVSDISWDPTSPLDSCSRLPPYLARITVTESRPSQLGSQGIYPWIMYAMLSVDNTKMRRARSRRAISPQTLATSRMSSSDAIALPSCHPSERQLVMDSLWLFCQDPCLPEGGDTSITYTITLRREDTDWYTVNSRSRFLSIHGAFCGRLYTIPDIQLKFTTPQSGAGSSFIQLDDIFFDFGYTYPFRGDIEQLMRYDWKHFFVNTLRFTRLKKVQINLKEVEWWLRLSEEHDDMISCIVNELDQTPGAIPSPNYHVEYTHITYDNTSTIKIT